MALVQLMRVRPEVDADLPVPRPMSRDAAGFDLAAAVDRDAPRRLEPGERALIPTGFAMAIPPGWEGQVRPRSGLALRHGITCLNSPGTIDADYRGEVQVILINHGAEAFEVQRGMRIAQLVIARIHPVEVQLRLELESTERGSGGFGSTGLAANEE